MYMHPALAVDYLKFHDKLMEARGGRRNLTKTRVIMYVRPETLQANRERWHISELKHISTVAAPDDREPVLRPAWPTGTGVAFLYLTLTGQVED